jgi:hypothetical protein
MRPYPFVWILPLAFGVTLFGARASYARDCSASDCPRGYACVDTTASDDGGDAGTCLASACQTDSDCAAGFRCDIDAYTECVGGACGLATVCQPQYDVPCEADGDCGPGFTCSGSVGGYNCGAHQDAGYPYGTTMTVPCEDVPGPPIPLPPDSGFDIPPICQPGSTCTSNTYKTCQSQAPSSCSVDSDCPSTWTCGCEQVGGFGGELPLLTDGAVATDAACTKTCIAPNSDLGFFGGENGAGGTFGPTLDGFDAATTENTGAPSPDAAASNTAAAASHASDAQGGCDMGGRTGTAGWLWAPIGALFAASRRRSRRPRKPAA